MRRHSDNSRSADSQEDDDHETPGAETEPQQAAGHSGGALQLTEKL
jgi:hypothetical protein